MKCIVTTGPTYEELDEVRRLTNFSTGRLGTELANYLAERGHEVELLRSEGATCHLETGAKRVLPFNTTADLRRRLKALGGKGVTAVFHAAAVSDFGFGRIWERNTQGELREFRGPKIPTREGILLAELKPTPKIILELRDWFPNAFLVGWKYELESDRAHAIERARRQLEEGRTDACVVNGRAYGEGFGLVAPGRRCRHMGSRRKLFAALAREIQERKRGKY